MRRPTLHPGLYVAAALSGIAAAYVLNEWILPWWDARVRGDTPDDTTETSPPSPTQDKTDPPTEIPAPATDPEHAGPSKDTHTQPRSLPPLRTHSLPPPLPNGCALPFIAHPDAMTSSTSLHTLSTQDGAEEEDASHSNTSDTDAESFIDILSPSPTHVVSRRRSFRNHDLFAESHISFSELGSLVAPENDPH